MGECAQQAVRDDPTTDVPKYIKQLKYIEIQRRDSSHLDRTLNSVYDGALSYMLIPSISAYSEEQKNSPGFDRKNVNTMWKRILPTNGKDSESWDIVDQQQEVENLCLECMKLHFSQSNNTPLTTDYWMKQLLDPAVQEKILNGTYDFTNIPEPIKIFFEALKLTLVNDDLKFEYPYE